MKKKYVNVIFNCSTDGDFNFKNDDNFFKSSFEFYSKEFTCENNKDDLINYLELFLKEINDRVFNYYKQRDGLVNFFKELNLNIFDSVDFENIDFESISILSGNQDVEIILQATDIPIDNTFSSTEIGSSLNTLKKEYLRLENEIELIRNHNSEEKIKEYNDKMLELVKIKDFIKTFIKDL